MTQAATNEMRRQHVMRVALESGIVTDHMSDDICEQLLVEGWLERAEPIARVPRRNRAPAYLPTEKAANEWNQQD